MKLFSRIRYYAASIMTLLTRFERPFQILKIFLHWPDSLPTEIQLKHSRLRFSVREAMDVWVIKETCIDADYLAGKDFCPDWTVVDIGAGLGDFTILAAKNCPDGQIFAYEPLKDSFDLLENNLTLNQVTNVYPFQQATASHRGLMVPIEGKTESVSTRLTQAEAIAEDETLFIPVITLAEILERLPNGHCHLMKIDCEGCEFDLLLNSPPELLARIDRLTIETHNGYTSYSTEQLAAHLQRHGFTVKRESNPVHGYLGFLYAERLHSTQR
jgi:FkbM family methyltransferase